MHALRRLLADGWDQVADLPAEWVQWASNVDEPTFWSIMAAGGLMLAFALGRAFR